MVYCTVSEVRKAIDFPDTGAPISDEAIFEFILDSQEEIEDIYKTNFGDVEDSGTASSATTDTLTDSTKDWDTTDITDFTGYVLWIYSGTGAGQYREIGANTQTTLTVTEIWATTPDTTSKYRITKLGYKDQTVDGSGTETQFVEYQPLISLNYLMVDSVQVTPANVYQYKASGRLNLSHADAEVRHFSSARKQLVDLRYVFGVYPMPRIIKRLCILLSAMRTMTAQIAGTYDDFANITLPHVSASKGEPYLNIQASLNYMQGEARGIIYGFVGEQVSADFRSMPSYRPFVVFG